MRVMRLRIPDCDLSALVCNCFLSLLLACFMSSVGCSSMNNSGGGSGSGGNPNPVPSITSITPANATAGSGNLTVAIGGEGFLSTSTVEWNGSPLTTTLNGNQLNAIIPAADIATVGGAQITVVNPSPGGGPSNPAGFAIIGAEAGPTPGYAYVSSAFDGTIVAFSVDPTTGGLTSVPGSPFPVPGAPFSPGQGPQALTADPAGKFLYIANNPINISSADDLPAFAVDPSSGALSAVPGSPFTTGSLEAPVTLAVDSSGKFLYVADQDGSQVGGNNISGFSVNSATGALTSGSQAMCDAGLTSGVVTDPVGPFVFASNSSGSVCSFSINSQGALQLVGSPVNLGSLLVARSVGVDHFGKFVYVLTAPTTTALPLNIWAFGVSAEGSLTAVPGSPFATGGTAGDSPFSIASDPLGRFVYISNFFDISGFSVNSSTGALSMLAGFPIATQVSEGVSAVVDPSGKFLYVANNVNETVSAYVIDVTLGTLTPVPGSPYAAGSSPTGVTVPIKPQ
jgi:6-phosphogluconolactonase (cycloisomerase 2 family)